MKVALIVDIHQAFHVGVGRGDGGEGARATRAASALDDNISPRLLATTSTTATSATSGYAATAATVAATIRRVGVTPARSAGGETMASITVRQL